MTADVLKMIENVLVWWEKHGQLICYDEPDFVTQAKKLKESINPNDLPI